MRYSEFIGKPRFATGVQGICYDFNDDARIWLPKGNFHIKCTVLDTFTIYNEKNVEVFDGDGYVLYCDKSYYTHWLVEIQKDRIPLCSVESDLKDRNVMINFLKANVMALGEFISALTVVEKFRRKHQCNIFVIVDEKYLEISQRSYSDITFTAGEFDDLLKIYQQLPKNIYATYNINAEVCNIDATAKQIYFLPADFRSEGSLRFSAVKLGLYKCCLDKPDKLFLSSYNSGKKIQEPYVCISGRGSGIKKRME